VTPAVGLIAGLIAFAVALVFVRLLERHAAALHLVDEPNARSSHVVPRPRGGGVGIWVGVGAGLLAVCLLGAPLSAEGRIVLAAAGIVGVAGLWDDLMSLGIWPRLAIQAAAALLVVLWTGGLDRLPLPPPGDIPLGGAGSALAVIWIVAVTNFFNFMDGADGLAAGQSIISMTAVTLVAWPSGAATIALVVSCGTVAFLLRNWSPARIFLGDAGSAFLGFLLGALPLAASPDERGPLALLLGISLALFLLDPAVTLVVRTWRGAAVGQAHREHAYQRLFDPRGSHAVAVSRLLGAAAMLAGFAVLGWYFPSAGWAALAAGALVFAVEWRLAATRGGSEPRGL
jgi:Fuc2NAc and GlcNAc transferase